MGLVAPRLYEGPVNSVELRQAAQNEAAQCRRRELALPAKAGATTRQESSPGGLVDRAR